MTEPEKAPENKLKQRIVGALVLIALAVVFLPILFKQEDPVREVVVQAPPMPEINEAPQFPAEEAAVPEPEVDDTWDQAQIIEEPAQAASTPLELIEESAAEAESVAPATKPVAKPVDKAEPGEVLTQKTEPKPAAPGIDKNNLPVSWSVQLASLSNKTNAEALRDTYRKKQYNAYVRSTDGVYRVLIGPLVKQTEAQAMCKNLKTRESQECFVVRYQP